MPEKKFDLGDYVEVKDRIAKFYELFGQGRLVTGEVRLTNEPDGVPRVLVQGLAYRSPEDTHPGVGWSWMELPGKTTYTKGSELENTETSAWGRAIGSLGILIDHSIASGQEVKNKEGEPVDSPDNIAPKGGEVETLTGRVSRRGVIRANPDKKASDDYKLVPRQTPDGIAVGFRLEVDADKAIPQVLVAGRLGVALTAAYPDPSVLAGTVATVAGILYHVKSGKGSSWYRLHVDRFENADWILPADPVKDEPALPEPPEDVELVGEAESKPLGLVS